jgi:hypothetical protein
MATSGLEACTWSAIRAIQRAASPTAAAAAHRAAAQAVRELQRAAGAADAPVSAGAWEALAQLLQTPNVHAAEAAAALVVGSGGARIASAGSAPACDDLTSGALVQVAAAHAWELDPAARALALAFVMLQTRDKGWPCARRAGRAEAVAAAVRSVACLLRRRDRGDPATSQLARECAYRLLGQVVFLDDRRAAAAELLGDQGLLRLLVRDVPRSAPLVTALASSQCCGAGRRVLEVAPELPRALAEALARGLQEPDYVLAALYDLCSTLEGARARTLPTCRQRGKGRGRHAGGVVPC